MKLKGLLTLKDLSTEKIMYNIRVISYVLLDKMKTIARETAF